MIVLVGFMGAGKSSVGSLIAARLGRPFVDTDAVVEKRAGASIDRIFVEGGEPAFRAFERDVVAEALAGPDGVIALGGGALADPATVAALEWATVVHLDVSFGEALKRIGSSVRPMLKTGDPKALFDARAAVYRRVAEVIVTTDGRPPEEVADAVVARIVSGEGDVRPRSKATDSGLRTIDVDLPDGAYQVLVGAGIATKLHEFLPSLPDAEKAFVVTHPSLESLAAPVLDALSARGLAIEVVTVPEGESSKSLAAVESLYERLADAAAHRADPVVSVGGGVVCDLAGFVASTYNRGLPLIHVPTSLLAQVDAAIGGKTGVNLPHGKNLVGTFYQPLAVYCDVDMLRTVPDAEFTSGLAEVIKHGLIADPDLLEVVERDAGALAARDADLLVEVVARSVGVKAGIVAADEREQSGRAHLNYGHTFAHALEQTAGFSGLRHGDAVALGMMAAAYLAHDMGRIDEDDVLRHRRVLEAVGLPTRVEVGADDLESAWTRDKKHRGGVRFVLLAAIGKPEAGVLAPREAVVRALQRLGDK